jgi:3-deoxy-D-manno-octulosonic-acid transferase
MLTLYKIIMNTVYAVMWPNFLLKGRKSRDEWSQRRVLHPEKYMPTILSPDYEKPKGRTCLHFHASSMGEVRVLERLIKAINEIRPDFHYCVSTYTRTGQGLAREVFAGADGVFYFPIDGYFPLRRFFKHFRPDGVVMVETEIWPYWLDFCHRRDIPMVLANGRLSAKSIGYYQTFRSALRPLLGVYRKFIMQTEADAERIISIGADPGRTMALGNIKYDLNQEVDIEAKRSEVRRQLGLPDDRLFMIAASTRPGEEEIILKALGKTSVFPENLSFLLAPRHLERLDEVIEVIESAGLTYVLHSDLKPGQSPESPIVLMDKMGLLAEIFFGADLAFVGGTLADLGGHNIMEPVLAGVPVLFGPSVYNVADAAEQVVQEKQGLMIHTADDLAQAIDDFAGRALIFQKPDHSGPSVAERTAKIIVKELGL